MITSVLIANRGEIACRVIRTAQRLGIRTVAVYSDADAKALHVRMADEAVHIGASPARESYLVGEKIIAAAKQTGAEAIHPGYGFLSENADFAQAVLDAGLIWVGPKPASIRAMGLKDAAKKLMAEAGVPVTPGYMGDDQTAERLAREADAIGYPVLIKAVAGGGGKGMRKVDAAADFADALDSCRREAVSSFGNDVVLLEKWIESPRHIEVQVFGDSHGNVVHLFERDCSLQRRHQKVIEEAPAPGMDEATREAVCGAAVRAAQAVNYEGAGTIEFIADGSEGLRADRIWFMEMNTRLQVEHPVTEAITGQDLVEWQLRVASGEPLPKRQDELSITGHAIEARLYAEDPATGFLPSVGRLELFRLDDAQGALDVRIDSGVGEGDAVSPYYDPMIAKLIAHDVLPDGHSRAGAIGALSSALTSQLRVWPVKTNAAFCNALITDPDFREGRVDTGFIAERIERLTAPVEPSESMLSSALSRLQEQGEAIGSLQRPLPPPPRPLGQAIRAFRLNAPSASTATVYVDGQAREVRLTHYLGTMNATIDRIGDTVILTESGRSSAVSLRAPAKDGVAAADGTLRAPMPGKVTSVDVADGVQVVKGQRLLTLEAMKMEHAMLAPFDGTVAEIAVSAGAQVQVDALLARIEKQ